MKKSLILNLFLSFMIILTFAPIQKSTQTNGSASPASKTYISIIVQRESPYWKAISTGALNAAKDYGVEVLITAPKSPPPDTLSQQIDLFKNALVTTPSAIILSALDTKAFTPYLEQAEAANIPVIGIDSDVDSPIVKTSVSTDNYGAGELAAHKMAQLVGEKGQVGILTHRTGIKSALYRRDGFVNTLLENYPDIEILPIQYGTGTTESLIEGATTLLKEYPDIKGIFGTNRDTSEAIIDVVKELDKVDQIKIIGFDSSKTILDAIREGIVSGAIAQDPVTMGYKAVEAAIKASEGEELPAFIDTGFAWYDKFNMDNPEIRPLLYE